MTLWCVLQVFSRICFENCKILGDSRSVPGRQENGLNSSRWQRMLRGLAAL